MTIPTFSPIKCPDDSMDVEVEPTLLKAQFGDGYTQRAANGINAQLGTYSPHWSNANKAEADYILNFIKGQAGYQPFYWTPNGETQQLVFVCEKWSYAKKSGGYVDISLTLAQAPLA